MTARPAKSQTGRFTARVIVTSHHQGGVPEVNAQQSNEPVGPSSCPGGGSSVPPASPRRARGSPVRSKNPPRPSPHAEISKCGDPTRRGFPALGFCPERPLGPEHPRLSPLAE